MSSNSKFLFDTEFGSATALRKKADEAPEAPPLLYSEEDKIRLCEEAFRSGITDGKQEALKAVEASTAEVLNTINVQLQNIAQTHGDQLENIRCEAASLACAIAKKLAPALIARQPEVEVLAMIEECLVDLHDEPRIVLRASEAVCSSIAEKIDKLTATSGFQGNVILLPDETKTNGDCRIEWADGGVEREISDTNDKVDEIIHRFIRSGGNLGEN